MMGSPDIPDELLLVADFCDAVLLHAVNEIPANNAAQIKPIFFIMITP